MKRCIFSLLILSILLLSACSHPGTQTGAQPLSKATFKADYDWILPDFNFIDQNGKELGKSSVKGRAWLANFVFTNCSSVCSPMTANLADLQRRMNKAGLHNPIVSFTVDPDRDTPQALKKFAQKFGADFTTWHFVTGYDQEEISQFAHAFKTLAVKEKGTDQFMHSTQFYLVNKEGIIVKSYDGLSVPYEQIIADLKALR